MNPESPRARSPPSPRRRPRRPSPSPPPPRSSRHNPPSPPPRSRRHYSPYIPLPPELVGYTSTKSSRYQPSPPVSPPPARSRQRRSRSRSKVDDSAASRVDSNVQHEPTRTLFVGNLEREVRESKLKELFGRYGTIEESKALSFLDCAEYIASFSRLSRSQSPAVIVQTCVRIHSVRKHGHGLRGETRDGRTLHRQGRLQNRLRYVIKRRCPLTLSSTCLP